MNRVVILFIKVNKKLSYFVRAGKKREKSENMSSTL